MQELQIVSKTRASVPFKVYCSKLYSTFKNVKNKDERKRQTQNACKSRTDCIEGSKQPFCKRRITATRVKVGTSNVGRGLDKYKRKLLNIQRRAIHAARLRRHDKSKPNMNVYCSKLYTQFAHIKDKDEKKRRIQLACKARKDCVNIKPHPYCRKSLRK